MHGGLYINDESLAVQGFRGIKSGTDGSGPTQGFLPLMCTKLCKILKGMLASSRLLRENLIKRTDRLGRSGDSCIKKRV